MQENIQLPTDTTNETLIELLIQLLIQSLPEFQVSLDSLLCNCEDDLSIYLIMSELANFILNVLEQPEKSTSLIQRCFGVVETLAAADLSTNNQIDIIPAIRWAFLDELHPQAVQLALPWMGKATKEILESQELDESYEFG